MRRTLAPLSIVLLSIFEPGSALAASPPIEAFARMPNIRNVAISPDGERIAWITSHEDREFAVTVARSKPQERKPAFASQAGRFTLSSCNWVNDSRLLCGVRMMATDLGVVFGMTRLVSVNADGSDPKVLLERNNGGESFAQFHDSILHWTPDAPDTVLIQLDDDRDGFPSVFELNVYTGSKVLVSSDHKPIRDYTADAAGNVRLGAGYEMGSDEVEYFARLDGEREWRQLVKLKLFAPGDALWPIQIAPGTNRAYAQGSYEGRSALWEIDLTDQRKPVLVFSHPLVDASTPLMTADKRLLGIAYETDRPFVYYTDQRASSVIAAVNKQLPAKFNSITSMSRDGKVVIIRSASDVDAGSWYVFDTTAGTLVHLGSTYPELDPATLGRVQSISYKARDGVEVPGYLTTPQGVRAENLPLIVMPHGGPVSRDSWEFFFLREFLVSRGYAVLQMNYRGSSGYGEKWRRDAHQDWGGLTYSDIVDGARWSIERGIADPKRMCIVGWSFGGYSALVGAVRNGDLFHCSASIAGVSDLVELQQHARFFTGRRFMQEQLGTDSKKLKEDSPLRHVDKIAVPVLLIHGDKDAQVDVIHSRKMTSALKGAKKPHRAIFLEDATHQLDRKSDRMTLLTELEKFLQENIGPGVVREADGPAVDAEKPAMSRL